MTQSVDLPQSRPGRRGLISQPAGFIERQLPLGGLVRFFFHRDGLFTFPAPEIIEFRPPDIALAFNFDFGDSGRV
jgi:hypothetical protein